MLKFVAMEIEEILKRLYMVAAFELRHKNYARTLQLAKLYAQLVAGKDLDSLLKQFVRRESAEMFEQRKTLTQHIVTAVSKNLSDVFYKVPRSNSARRVLAYEGNDQESSIVLNDRLDEFWGTDSFDDYMATRWITLNMLDPNGFLVFEIKNFDPANEYAKPYPFEVFSEDAVDYKYTNKVLDYLIVKGSVKVPTQEPTATVVSTEFKQPELQELPAYTLYTKDQVFKIAQLADWQTKGVTGVSTEGVPQEVQWNGETVKVVKLNKKYYLFQEFEPHNNGEVNAIRIGYTEDLMTRGETRVNPIHAATPYLLKSIKTNSELDLTASLLAFPQQIKYGKKCTADDCYQGYNSENKPCNTCGGTGLQRTAPTAQDAIVLTMPDNPEEMVSLDDIVKYVSPPVDIIKWQEEYIEKLTNNAREIIFNRDIYDRKQVAETVIGKNIDIQNVYDTLYPLATAYARTWEFGVWTVARFIDKEKGLVARLTFGKDFKLKSLNDLMVDLSEANNSNADDALIRAINNDIAQILYAEQPTELKRYHVKQALNPFSGKTDKEILVLLSSPYVPEATKVLYSNFGYIFDEIELEYGKAGEDFYSLTKSKQKELIDKKVQTIISQLQLTAPTLPPGDEGV